MTTPRASILLAGGGSGGHVFPLLSVADALRDIAPGVALTFVGTERGMEADLVPKRGYALELTRVLPIRGRGVSGAFQGVWRAAMSLPESRALVLRLAPCAVLSIGGYAAGPVSLAARLARVPVLLIEPNSVMGLANRLIAPLVQRGYTAFAGAERHFRAGRVLRTGVPIRAGFEPSPYERLPDRLRVLVLGGSQGAKSLNETVPAALARVSGKLSVTHQCGKAHLAAVRATYEKLQPEFDLEVTEFIEDMPSALARADLVISRSGASAVSEIAAVGRPALFVPYPFAAGDHQRKNAEAMAEDGAAISVPAEAASVEHLCAEIERLAQSPEALELMAEAARRRGRPRAAVEIARDVLGVAGLSDPSFESQSGAPSESDPEGQRAKTVASSWAEAS